MRNNNLYSILQTESPDALLKEVETVLRLMSPDFDLTPVHAVFDSTFRLFEGKYPGYQACNTRYHDFFHTAGVFLAMTRLIHGALLHGNIIADRYILLGLTAALFHDAGYIQENHDRTGTGAKYTKIHVQRSMDFLERHAADHGLSPEEIVWGRTMILTTDLSVAISEIVFPSGTAEFLGKMLAVADFLAQMSDRMYLEKLLFLYQEFKEGGVAGFDSETDLLQKTRGFYKFSDERIQMLMDKTGCFLRLHFAARWNRSENLYRIAMDKQKAYLEKIVKMPKSDILAQLKRGGIVRELFGECPPDSRT